MRSSELRVRGVTGVTWDWGEWSGSEGSQLHLAPTLPPSPLPPQRWWGPQYILSCSLVIGSKVEQAGSKESKLGAFWGPRKVPGTHGYSGSKGNSLQLTLLAPSSLQGPRNALRARGASWEQGEQAGGSRKVPGTQEPSITFGSLQLTPSLLQGPRDALEANWEWAGVSWEWGERAGSKGSKLGAFWGSRKVPGTQGPSITFGSLLLAPAWSQLASGTQGCSGSKLGARGVSWEQGDQAWGFLRLQEGSRDLV